MSTGRLEQLAPPRELYESPANAFVASFIGTVNKLPVTGDSDGRWRVLGRSVPADRHAAAGQSDVAAVRPEQVAVDADAGGTCRVVSVSFLGPMTRVILDDAVLGRVVADIVSADAAGLVPGQRVRPRLRDDVAELVLIGAE
jgi:putative spermidine/putrescine transport system ATP-binding protein